MVHTVFAMQECGDNIGIVEQVCRKNMGGGVKTRRLKWPEEKQEEMHCNQ